MFLLEGLPSIVVGILVLFYLDDRIVHAKWLTSEEKTLLARNIESDNVHKVEETVGRVLMQPRTWLMGLIYFSFVMGLYGMSFWLPTIIKQTGITDTLKIGLLSAIPWAFSVVAMIVVSRHADRTGERRWHIAIPSLIGAAGFVVSVLYRENTTIALAGLTLGVMAIMIALPLFWSLPATSAQTPAPATARPRRVRAAPSVALTFTTAMRSYCSSRFMIASGISAAPTSGCLAATASRYMAMPGTP